ncbi:MAG: hypothetical protein IPI49_29060 [Myxococcales bacterium]|nr:hypothetical protein [Myxococcales bacterium]
MDTTTGKELGSTTWSTGQGDSAAAAVVRLLAPAEYVGKLQLRLPIQSAVIYVNGRKLLASASGTHSLPVGTHALRVTHPEVRDFVRFVDISYGAVTQVDVVLTPLPVVQHDVEARQAAARADSRRPWYRTWWAVAGGAGLAAVLAGVVTYSLTDNFDPDVTLP